MEKIDKLAKLYKDFMDELGIEVDHNSRDTPTRVAKMFLDKTKSLREDKPKITVFPNDQGYDQYVVIRDIPYYSICSHHHVPFYGKAHICYHPGKVVAGLSKFARIVTYFANMPQIQEEMTSQIANYIMETISPVGLLVSVEGEHLCMTSRGAKAVGSTTVTQSILGEIDKQESMKMIEMNK